METNPFSIRISLLGTPSATEIVTVQSSTSTDELMNMIRTQFGKQQSARSSLSITKKSTREGLDLGGKKTVGQLGIIKQDSLIVSFTAPSEAEGRGRGAAKPPPATVATKPPPATVATEPPPAAAASNKCTRVAAENARRDIAKKLIEEAKKAKKEQLNRRRRQQDKKNSKSTPHAHKQKPNKRIKIEGGGRKLSSGEFVPGVGGKVKTRCVADVMEIVSALGAELKDDVSKLRTENNAIAYVAAVDSGNYHIEIAKGGCNVEGKGHLLGTANDYAEVGASNCGSDLGARAVLETPYKPGGDHHHLAASRRMTNTTPTKRAIVTCNPKGIGGKGSNFCDTIDIIPVDALTEVIKNAHEAGMAATVEAMAGPDGSHKDHRLTPTLIAQLSPRSFWSLVHHFGEGCQSVGDMLQKILPSLDWSYVVNRNGRMKFLSPKAEENWEQQLKKKAEVVLKDEQSFGTRHDSAKAYRQVSVGLKKTLACLKVAMGLPPYMNHRDQILYNAIGVIEHLLPDINEETVLEIDDDEEDLEGYSEEENELAHMAVCRCKKYLNWCHAELEHNELSGTLLDMLLMIVEGVRCSLVEEVSTDSGELLEIGRGLTLRTTCVACFMGARRVALELIDKTFGPSATLITGLSCFLVAREVNRSPVKSDDKTMFENKRELFKKNFESGVYWVNQAHMQNRESNYNSGDSERVVEGWCLALSHLMLLMGDVKKCETSFQGEGNAEKRGGKQTYDDNKTRVVAKTAHLQSLVDRVEEQE